MLCPQPVVSTRSVINDMAQGELLEVIATDPLAELDLAVFCHKTGHELVHAERGPDTLRVLIRVSSRPPPAAD